MTEKLYNKSGKPPTNPENFSYQHRQNLILERLRTNGRERFTEISKKTNIPVSTIFEITKRLQQTHIIKKYTAIIDFEQIGYPLRAILLLKVKKDSEKTFKNYIEKSKKINTCSKISNDYNYVVEIIGKSIKDIENEIDFFQAQLGVHKLHCGYILEDICREKFYNDNSPFVSA